MASENHDWFVRNADVRNPNAAIRRDPAYFADECAAAIVNGTLTRTDGPGTDAVLAAISARVDDEGVSDAEFRRLARESLATIHITSSTTS